MRQVTLDPVRWQPPRAPARAGRRRSDVPLPSVRALDVGGSGPEDVLVDPSDGTVITGVEDGRVLRVDPRSGQVSTITDTGGRPLGLEWLPDGRLLVCDAYQGLLAVPQASGTVDVLVTHAGGTPVRFCNNASVAADGTVWFSDSSARFGFDAWKADILEHGGTGRLLRRTPDRSVDVVAAGLNFPNGVAWSDEHQRGYVVESGSYSLSTFTLDGTVTPLVTNLPGFPDNIALGTDGLLWVTLASPRNPVLDALAPLPGVLRRVVWALPETVQPRPAHQVWVVAVDPASGAVVHDLQGEHPQFGLTTGVREHHGTIWLGSLVGTSIASFTVGRT